MFDAIKERKQEIAYEIAANTIGTLDQIRMRQGYLLALDDMSNLEFLEMEDAT